jgi:16S rRNA processing protein RimM
MGRIGAPWGIKGWVKLFSFTDPPETLLDRHRYLIEGEQGLVPLEFDELRAQGREYVGHIKGCDVREALGSYTGKELWLAKTELPVLAEGYYWYQLEGCLVQHLLETGANDVLVIKGDDASVDKTERLVPYVKDRVVLSVDLAKAVILVDWDKDY